MNCDFVAVFYLSSCPLDKVSDLKDVQTIRREYFNKLLQIKELNDKLKWLVIQAAKGTYHHNTKCMQHPSPEFADMLRSDFVIWYLSEETAMIMQNPKHRRLFPANLHHTNFIRDLCTCLEKLSWETLTWNTVMPEVKNFPYIDVHYFQGNISCYTTTERK